MTEMPAFILLKIAWCLKYVSCEWHSEVIGIVKIMLPKKQGCALPMESCCKYSGAVVWANNHLPLPIPHKDGGTLRSHNVNYRSLNRIVQKCSCQACNILQRGQGNSAFQ